MRRSIRFLILPTLAIGVIVLPLVLPGSAYAKGHTGVRVNCTKVSGSGLLEPGAILTGCSEPQASGGSATISFDLGSGNDTVTWGGGLGTTTFRPIVSGPRRVDKCAKINPNDVEEHLHGKVVSSSPAGGSPGVRGPVSALICINVSGETLLPGTPFKF